MLIESVGASIIVGKLRGGRLQNLRNINIKGVWFFAAAAFIQATAAFLVAKQINPVWQLLNSNAIWIQAAVYGLLFLGLLKNIKIKGFKLIGLGVLLNCIVITLNAGKMPVEVQSIADVISQHSLQVLQNGQSFTHIAASTSSRVMPLADIIHLTKPYPFPKSLSIGDIFMMMGIFVMLYTKLIND